MTRLSRRTLLAAAGTVAAAVPLRKPRAQEAGEPLESIAELHALHEPRKLDDLRWVAADGGAVSLSDFAGKGVVLNLWATWCVPCVREMPALDGLAQAVAASGVVVLPLSSDRGGAAAVQQFYQQRGIKRLPIMLDPRSAVAEALNVRGIPTTLLIDKQGQEVGWIEGAVDWTSADAITVVKKVAT